MFKIGDKVKVMNLPDDQHGVIVGKGSTPTVTGVARAPRASPESTIVWWKVKLDGSGRIVDVPSDKLTLDD